ncbi:pyruvate kinase [Mycoplasma sp. 4044]
MQKTKIVATIGPSSDNLETMKSLLSNGITCVRANFSHGSGQDHKHKFDLARQASDELGVNVSLMLDTKGPEIRIGKMLDDIQPIQKDQTLELVCDPSQYKEMVGNSQRVCVSYEMHKDLKVGDTVLLDDGKLQTKVIKIENSSVFVKANNSHNLKTNKRINIPGVEFSLPFMSQKDRDDVLFGIEYGVDIIAASFVNNKENLIELRNYMHKHGGDNIQICSKIESQSGVNNIDEIIEHSDSIMVARGDLGLEIPFYEVPRVEKMIIKKCLKAKKPVIVATQMLDSMEKNPLPTRAEVTDIYWANELGADSTMLSGETASGNFPLEAVKVMHKVNQSANEDILHCPTKFKNYITKIFNYADESEKWAYDMALELFNDESKYLVVFLQNDINKLKTLAKYRPKQEMIVFVNDEKLKTRFGIDYNINIQKQLLSYDEFKKSGFSSEKLKNSIFTEKNSKILTF